jgi:hypothetical protein
MSRPNPRMDAAVRYAAHGWPVFPLQPGEKIPLLRTHGLLEATTDERQIARWLERHPDRNIGIATGAPGPDVLDVDNKGQRSSGSADYNMLKREGLIGQPQAIVSTPSRGFHAYFAGTDQHNGSLREHGLDYRSRGGYVVAVPSSVDGRRYQLVTRHASADTCDWTAIRSRLEPEPERPGWQPREGQHGVSHLADWLAGVPEGRRNGALFWSLNRALEAGDRDTFGRLAEAARAAGLTKREIAATVRSAERTTPCPKAQTDREAG